MGGLSGIPDAHVSMNVSRSAVVTTRAGFGNRRLMRMLRVDLGVGKIVHWNGVNRGSVAKLNLVAGWGVS